MLSNEWHTYLYTAVFDNSTKRQLKTVAKRQKCLLLRRWSEYEGRMVTPDITKAGWHPAKRQRGKHAWSFTSPPPPPPQTPLSLRCHTYQGLHGQLGQAHG